MTALKVLVILAVLLVLLSLTRVGAVLRFDDTLTVIVKIGPLRMQILPAKKKKKAKKEPQKPRNKAETKQKKSLPKLHIADVRDAVQTLWPAFKRALNRTRRGVRIDPLNVAVVLGGASEPADAARLYGELHGAVWAGMPVLEQLLVIPEPHIRTDVDFTAEETTVQGAVGFSARIGTLIGIGITIAVPALKWLLNNMKKKRVPVGKDDLNGNGKEKSAA